jgi:hypothetical protein
MAKIDTTPFSPVPHSYPSYDVWERLFVNSWGCTLGDT